MSTTPIFDATLADAPANIWEASSIFPRPATFPTLYDDRLDSILYSWGAYSSRYKAKVLGEFAVDNPATPINPDYRDWTFINGIPVIRSAAA